MAFSQFRLRPNLLLLGKTTNKQGVPCPHLATWAPETAGVDNLVSKPAGQQDGSMGWQGLPVSLDHVPGTVWLSVSVCTWACE